MTVPIIRSENVPAKAIIIKNPAQLGDVTVVTQVPGVGPPGTPPGGTTGQVAAKLSNDDYDIGWVTVAGTGDMQAAVYDPQSIADDTFDLGNMTGTLDLGTFL